jgi:DNA (cytosine-5)-methyltransferase 1
VDSYPDPHRRPRALDLFCGEGGASKGLQLAGFNPEGVDIKAMPRYPYTFHLGDALDYPTDGFEFIWASPPCQLFSPLARREDLSKFKDLIEPTRAKLKASGLPWVMENVPDAPLRADLTLCANSFGLRSYRHRIFECSFPVIQPPHKPHMVRVNRRGENRRQHWANGGHITITGDIGVYVGPEAMGINWMSGNGLSEAIPPVYARFIAQQYLTGAWLASKCSTSDASAKSPP